MAKKRTFEEKVSNENHETTCVFNDHGFKCSKRGALSPSTNGSGPWYCSEHAWVFLGGEPQQSKKPAEPDIAAEAAKYCAERGLDTVEKMRAFVLEGLANIGKRNNNRDWARQIMQRIENGEKLPLVSEQKARAALGIDKPSAKV